MGKRSLLGFVPYGLTNLPHIARETGIWKKVIADAGIRLDCQAPAAR
jgi:hypothetical protein